MKFKYYVTRGHILLRGPVLIACCIVHIIILLSPLQIYKTTSNNKTPIELNITVHMGSGHLFLQPNHSAEYVSIQSIHIYIYMYIHKHTSIRDSYIIPMHRTDDKNKYIYSDNVRAKIIEHPHPSPLPIPGLHLYFILCVPLGTVSP